MIILCVRLWSCSSPPWSRIYRTDTPVLVLVPVVAVAVVVVVVAVVVVGDAYRTAHAPPP